MPIGGVNPDYGQSPSWFSNSDQTRKTPAQMPSQSSYDNTDSPRYSQRITAHGNPFHAETSEDSNVVKSGKKVSKDWSVQINPLTKHIVLQSCHGATGGPFSNAQMLANETGRTVTGYKGPVTNLSGDPKRFEPQGKLTAAFTGAVNSTIGGALSAGSSTPPFDQNKGTYKKIPD